MRVDIATKQKRQESSLPLLLAFTGMLSCAYILSLPSVAGQFPLPMERALTNLKRDIDATADAAARSASSTYQSVVYLFSGR
jgi:hypothetical protein